MGLAQGIALRRGDVLELLELAASRLEVRGARVAGAARGLAVLRTAQIRSPRSEGHP